MDNKTTQDTEQPKSKRAGWKTILLNIGLIVVAGLLLLWGAMWFLDIYTKHDKAFRLPDIKGMTQEEAEMCLRADKLLMEVTDSLYVEGKAPGVIIETTPKAGALIKSNRVIYVTVNTMSAKMIRIPQYQELSERSVEMMLKGAGFVDIIKEYVPGEHNLLVLRIKDASGRYLMPGDRVPYNERLTVEVSSSDAYQAAMLDSLVMEGINSSEDMPTHEEPTADPEGDGEDWF